MLKSGYLENADRVNNNQLIWKPVLSDEIELSSKVINVIEDIKTSLIHSEVEGAGLMKGKSGILLFLAYYRKFKSLFSNHHGIKQEDYEFELTLVQEIAQTFNSNYRLNWCRGLAGISWSLKHLEEHQLLSLQIKDFLKEADKILYEGGLHLIKKKDIDFLHGALGIFIYLIDRQIPSTKISYLLQAFEKEAFAFAKKAYWINNKYSGCETNSNGLDHIVLFGLAHGMSGILTTYTLIQQNYGLPSSSIELIKKCLNFLNGYFQPKLGGSYPSAVHFRNGREINVTRTPNVSWCHGDLGLARALYLIGKELNLSDLIKRSQNVFDLYEQVLVKGNLEHKYPGLCHGSCSPVLIFGRMYNDTKEEKYKKLAVFWVEQVLTFYNKNHSRTGKMDFSLEMNRRYGSDIGNSARNESEFSLLDGLAGLGLVLISTVTPIAPSWDRCFLLS